MVVFPIHVTDSYQSVYYTFRREFREHFTTLVKGRPAEENIYTARGVFNVHGAHKLCKIYQNRKSSVVKNGHENTKAYTALKKK